MYRHLRCNHKVLRSNVLFVATFSCNWLICTDIYGTSIEVKIACTFWALPTMWDRGWVYERHILDVHNDKQECVCPHCDKLLSKISDLKDHIKDTHQIKGRNFICPLCSKELANEHNLKQHLRQHHGEKQECVCPQCGNLYSNICCLTGQYMKDTS